MGHRRRRARGRAARGPQHRRREGGGRAQHLPGAGRPRHAGAARRDRPRRRVLARTCCRRTSTSALAPTWSDFIISIPVAMVAYTGIETISNMAEEAIDPPRHVPRSIMYVVARGVRDLRVPAVGRALGAAGASRPRRSRCRTRRQFDCLEPRPEARRADVRPGLQVRAATRSPAWSRTSASRARSSSGLGYYVAILAATILIIATNAGIIGVSRLTYSMGQHRQLPEALRRVHPRSRRRTSRSSSTACVAVAADDPAGRDRRSSATCTRSARCCRSRSRTPR